MNIKIEKNIPMPERNYGRPNASSALDPFIHALQPGDSIGRLSEKEVRKFYQRAREKFGKVLSYRIQDDGTYRIWWTGAARAQTSADQKSLCQIADDGLRNTRRLVSNSTHGKSW